jgi:hypothetical protein
VREREGGGYMGTQGYKGVQRGTRMSGEADMEMWARIRATAGCEGPAADDAAV